MTDARFHDSQSEGQPGRAAQRGCGGLRHDGGRARDGSNDPSLRWPRGTQLWFVCNQHTVNAFSPYFQSFLFGAIWFSLVAFKLISRHSGHWSTYPQSNLVVLLVGWILTSLLVGFVCKRSDRLNSWLGTGFATVVCSMLVLWMMLFIVERNQRRSTSTDFSNADEMMAHFADEATRWVKHDRQINLNYSIESVKVVEEELGKVFEEVDKTSPQQGTFGIALGYGAYIGEVLRRSKGGSWAVDHPAGGTNSYPLTTISNGTVFPVGWCWKRLTTSQGDNVYDKVLLFFANADSVTNTVINAEEVEKSFK